MKILCIFTISTCSVVIKGWVIMLQPIALSLGAAFMALNLDVDLIQDIQPIIKWKNWLPLKKEKEAVTKKVAKTENKKLEEMIE